MQSVYFVTYHHHQSLEQLPRLNNHAAALLLEECEAVVLADFQRPHAPPANAHRGCLRI